MATTIPAIKPLVARHFPNILGHNLSRYGQATDGQMKTLERYPERNTLSPILSTSDFFRMSSLEFDVNEKGLDNANSRPLILSPVVSAFSTYRSEETPGSGSEWKGSTLAEGESSKMSIGSFDAMWTPKQTGDMQR